jgi:integrase
MKKVIEDTEIEILPESPKSVDNNKMLNKASNNDNSSLFLSSEKNSGEPVMSSGSSPLLECPITNSKKRRATSISLQKEKMSKRDKLRFFYPSEWYRFHSCLEGNKKFFYEFLINTGMRYGEAESIRVKDIDLERKTIIVIKAKRNIQRRIMISTQMAFNISKWIAENDLKPDDTLGFPSLQYADKYIKDTAKKAEISDFHNITTHTFRKTLENYLIALDVNTMAISMQLGHTVNVALAYYAAQFFKLEEKALIRGIIGDLLQK